MAIIKKITNTLEGAIEWSFDYDNSTTPFTLLRFRCINNHPTLSSQGMVWDDDHPPGDPQYQPIASPVVGPGQTWTQNVPAPVAARYQLSVDARGHLVGLNYSVNALNP